MTEIGAYTPQRAKEISRAADLVMSAYNIQPVASSKEHKPFFVRLLEDLPASEISNSDEGDYTTHSYTIQTAQATPLQVNGKQLFSQTNDDSESDGFTPGDYEIEVINATQSDASAGDHGLVIPIGDLYYWYPGGGSCDCNRLWKFQAIGGTTGSFEITVTIPGVAGTQTVDVDYNETGTTLLAKLEALTDWPVDSSVSCEWGPLQFNSVNIYHPESEGYRFLITDGGDIDTDPYLDIFSGNPEDV